MSNPSNLLSAYRSYRYYHVLAICDSTRTAEALNKTGISNGNNDVNVVVDRWLHPADDKYGVKVVDLDLADGNTTTKGLYCILINGATDAELSITSAKWSSYTATSATPTDNANSLAVEGTLTISEPKGVTFADIIVRCCKQLGVDASTVIFCLKTFFVGWSDADNAAIGVSAFDTTNSYQMVSNIEPLAFIMYDLTATFSEVGGVYDMGFVAMSNGASRLPQYSRVTDGFNINFGAYAGDQSITIKNALELMSTVVQDNYDRYYGCVQKYIEQNAQAVVNQLLSNGVVSGDFSVEQYKKMFSRVKYQFNVDTEYENYILNDWLPQTKSTDTNCDTPGTLAAMPGTSIEDALRMLLRKSIQIQREMSQGDVGGIKYEPKIDTAVKTSILNRNENDLTGGELEIIVVYTIRRVPVPKSLVNELLTVTGAMSAYNNKAQNQLEPSPRMQKYIAENTIEFDYLYSGKNIDILEFDIKMNMGMAYIQTAATFSTLKGQLNTIPGTVIAPSVPDVQTRFNEPLRVPIFFGTHMKNPQYFNTRNPAFAMQSAYTLSQHASLETTDVTMKVVGNYRLLNVVNRTTQPSSAEKLKEENKQMQETVLPRDEASFKHWGYFPALAKVNVYMPSSTDDVQLFQQNDKQDLACGPYDNYRKQFWYTGLYYVIGIDHSFENGEFTQTLHMLSMPQKLPEIEKTKTITESLEECYEGKRGCGGNVAPPTTTTSPPTAPNRSGVAISPARDRQPLQAPSYSENPLDGDSVFNANQDLSKVLGWSAASQDVKEAILTAAKESNLNPVLLAAIASKETRLKAAPQENPNYPRSRGGPDGLFQQTGDTWLSLVSKGLVKGLVRPPILNQSFYDKRKNPLLSARAGAAQVQEGKVALERAAGRNGVQLHIGDYYMNHVLGGSGARRVIEEYGKDPKQKLLPTFRFGTTTSARTLTITRTQNPAIFTGRFKDADTPELIRQAFQVALTGSMGEFKPPQKRLTQTPYDINRGVAESPVSTSQQRTVGQRISIMEKRQGTIDCKAENPSQQSQTGQKSACDKTGTDNTNKSIITGPGADVNEANARPPEL